MTYEVWQGFAQNDAGDVLDTATVTVTLAGTTTKPALFSDEDGTGSKTNPFTTDASGFVQFYTAPAIVDIVATKGAFSVTFSNVRIGLPDALQTVATLAELQGLGSGLIIGAKREYQGLTYVLKNDVDYSTLTAADGAGVYISTTYSATSAWVADVGSVWQVDWFTLSTDPDSTLSFVRAIAVAPQGTEIHGTPAATYTLSKQDSDSAIKLAQKIGISLYGNKATLFLSNAQNCHIIKMIGGASDKSTSGECVITGWIMDSNMSNQTDDASNQDTIRITNSHDVEVFKNEIKNTNSGGVVCDGTDDVEIHNNYIHDIGRNGVIVGCSSTVDGERNIAHTNRIEDTGLNALGNGIFFTASSASVTTTTQQKNPKAYNNNIKNAGDIGIELGIRCIGGQVHDNTIDSSKNQGIIIRDNFKPNVHDNTIIVSATALTKSGITIDTQLGLADGNRITAAKANIHDNIITGVGANGIEIKDISQFKVHDNILQGSSTSGNVAVNIKGTDGSVYNNDIETFQRGVRITKENLASIARVRVYSNDIRDAVDGLLIENTTLSNSRIYNNFLTLVTNPFIQSAATLSSVLQYGNRVADAFGNPASLMSTYVNSQDGFIRASPAAQFGTVSIMAPAYNGAFRIVGDTTNEMAVFSVDAGSLVITKLAGSPKFGLVADGTDYRVEVSGSNIVLKRYSVSQTIANFKIESM